jgi:hypothetical protein
MSDTRMVPMTSEQRDVLAAERDRLRDSLQMLDHLPYAVVAPLIGRLKASIALVDAFDAAPGDQSGGVT